MACPMVTWRSIFQRATGATILSPINGEITEHYVDQYGNPTLIIENSRYKILMLHGDYTVQVGQPVPLASRSAQRAITATPWMPWAAFAMDATAAITPI